ncbi:GntR family transcriptional regulator [Streptomyces samsunensis]|uniref:GntR family transcriptional regulator n=1 Tax=Streptomyces malaysiensis TaxID=92644 RepID=UPI001583D5B7|nr:GntR family transcriptional regulator [Streptomyces samsunensis]NUH40163.1 GntR family transcriptional regulator [Streptomyces samsunensis]
MRTSGRDLPAATHHLLFGSLPTVDMAASVARRLRAAIGLGLLSDGERLPKEADLARQLGVTNFTLREALGSLREEGLLQTRPGKNGGSFVLSPDEGASLAFDELGRMSATHFRDLGDWRRMLASVSAALAAERAAETDMERLREQALLVARASTPVQARQAHARFHVELAVAAQSTRMSRAEFGMHEEFDWLFGRVLADTDRRQEAAEGLLAIANAVGRNDPEAARTAAWTHSTKTVEALARLRIEAIASQADGSSATDGRSLTAELQRISDLVMGRVRDLASGAAPLLAAGQASEITTFASEQAITALTEIKFPLDGAGVIAEPGVFPDRPYWLAWWHRAESGALEEMKHIVDPHRDDFYDYEHREFIARPRTLGSPWATGPYVDVGGVDDYTITLSAPIVHQGRFLGVAAADLKLADLERHLAPWLAAADKPTLLVNADRRVITSNSATHIVGDVVRPQELSGGQENTVFGWSVITIQD